MVRARVTAFAILALIAASAPAQPRDEQWSDTFAAERLTLAEALSRAVSSDAELVRLYGPPPVAPLWTGADGTPSHAARDAVRVLDSAASDGLDPTDYQTALLHQLLGEISNSVGTAPAAPAALVRMEIALSRAALRYLHDVRDGRVDPRTAGFIEFEPISARGDLVAALREAIASRQIVSLAATTRPRVAEYQALMIALARYRELASREPASVPIPIRKSVHPGEPFEGLAALQSRLVAVGDLESSAVTRGNDRFEGAVVDAVRRFQRRHGLEPDGVLGKRTISELMVPVSARVTQLELAMERLRWLPRHRSERLVLVNIPLFRLSAFERDTGTAALPVFSSRVIVGQAKKTETPIVSATMTEIQFRPYWNIPRSIVRNEVLPAIARQPDYLTRQNMELVSGERDTSPVVAATPQNLARLAAGTLRVRQRPGPSNSLGLIKFSFPNPHDVYMHATPARSLFARERRDFSHGCIRVEDTTGLAEWVLAAQSEWNRARIVATMEAATSSRVALDAPVRVLLFYATAGLAPQSSDIVFAEDIYGLDARLSAELARRPRTPLPAANAAGIDVHEFRGRVETDSAAPRSKRSASQLRQRNVGQTDVDGLPLHVKASGGDTL